VLILFGFITFSQEKACCVVIWERMRQPFVTFGPFLRSKLSGKAKGLRKPIETGFISKFAAERWPPTLSLKSHPKDRFVPRLSTLHFHQRKKGRLSSSIHQFLTTSPGN
jgi:hypothetical protein